MIKKILFALAPVMLLACSVHADDDLLTAIAKMDAGNDSATQLASSDDKLGQADIDSLLGDGEEAGGDAIAACFRRFSGHGGYGHRYGSYGGYGGYGHHSYYRGYSSCYPSYPSYSSCYTPIYTFPAPSYTCYTPCYTSYWGCN